MNRIDDLASEFKKSLNQPEPEPSMSLIGVRIPESVKQKYDELQSVSGNKFSKVISKFIVELIKKSEV